jgi:hypothetical protein
MINIDKYIDALCSNGVVMMADKYVNQMNYLEQTKNKKCTEILNFIDGANEIEKTHLYLQRHDEAEFWEMQKSKLTFQFINENPDNYIRNQTFNKCKFDFETKKRFTPKDYIDFVNDELATIKSMIECNPMYSIVENAESDKTKIDFQLLAELAGMWDFFNFLDAEKKEQDKSTPETTKKAKNRFNLRPCLTERKIKEVYEALTQHQIIESEFSQFKKLFSIDGFEVFENPINVLSTIKEIAFAFNELSQKVAFENKQWKADLANGKVFIKDGILLTAKNYSDAIGSIKYKDFITPKELFFF